MICTCRVLAQRVLGKHNLLSPSKNKEFNCVAVWPIMLMKAHLGDSAYARAVDSTLNILQAQVVQKVDNAIVIHWINPLGGGYSQKSWVGLRGPLPKTLTLFMTKTTEKRFPLGLHIPGTLYIAHTREYPPPLG